MLPSAVLTKVVSLPHLAMMALISSASRDVSTLTVFASRLTWIQKFIFSVASSDERSDCNFTHVEFLPFLKLFSEDSCDGTTTATTGHCSIISMDRHLSKLIYFYYLSVLHPKCQGLKRPRQYNLIRLRKSANHDVVIASRFRNFWLNLYLFDFCFFGMKKMGFEVLKGL